MTKTMLLAAAAAITAGAGALAQSGEVSTPDQSTASEQKICKMVANAELHSKPFELCLTKAQWDAKAIADAKDANRMICHYEEESGSRLHSRRICMPASDWAAQRQGDREAIERIQMQTCVPGAGC